MLMQPLCEFLFLDSLHEFAGLCEFGCVAPICVQSSNLPAPSLPSAAGSLRFSPAHPLSSCRSRPSVRALNPRLSHVFSCSHDRHLLVDIQQLLHHSKMDELSCDCFRLQALSSEKEQPLGLSACRTVTGVGKLAQMHEGKKSVCYRQSTSPASL